MCISFLVLFFGCWLRAIAKYFHQPNPQLPQSVLASLRAVSSLLWLLEVLSSARKNSYYSCKAF
nr:MAG TPA: hypothetical protein [Caudoviricetes sp.]